MPAEESEPRSLPAWPGDALFAKDATPVEKVQAFIAALGTNPDHEGYDKVLFTKHLHLQSATAHPTRSVTFTMTVAPELCNHFQNLHGGAQATLFDVVTSCAIPGTISRPGWWEYPGVSRTLNVTYLRAVPVETEIEIVAEVLGVGKRMCTLRGTMKRKADGALLAVAEHGKVNVDADMGRL